MCDEAMPTIISTARQGELGFQEYFVKHRWQPVVESIRHQNCEKAAMSPAVSAALEQAAIILIAPSNPWLSVAPILAVPGLRAALKRADAPVVAVTPIIAGAAVKGPTAKIMAELGLTVSEAAVAEFYDGIIDGFVNDIRNEPLNRERPAHDSAEYTDDGRGDQARFGAKHAGLDQGVGGMSLWVIIPVKPLKNAKSRLAPVLSPDQRFELAQAMFRHVLSVTTTIQQVTGVLVISRDTKALAIAREMGAKTLQEGAMSNLNPALLRATLVVQSWRADSVLVLPADLPFINAEDLRDMVQLASDRSIVIATDRNRDGTNALLIRPPGAIEYDYGSGSYERHLRMARAAGLQVREFQSERLSLDIDVPEDLREYQEILERGHFGHLPSFSILCGAS